MKHEKKGCWYCSNNTHSQALSDLINKVKHKLMNLNTK